jgi:hypothetical protein
VDFLHRRRPSLIGWLLLGLGIAAMATALSANRQWERERLAAESEARQRAEADARQRRLASAPMIPTAEERRLAQVLPRLRDPWLPTLRLIEGVTEAPVYLTALAIDPARRTVRIEAEAATFDAALTYAQLLYEPGVLDDAQLQSHERSKDAGSGEGLKFTVVARWMQR